jgi:FdrA protein
MPIINIVKQNRYQDSVTLMQVAVTLRAIAGVEDASLMMGTEPNKEMLAGAGLLAAEGRVAGPNDLIVAVNGASDALSSIEGELESLLQAEIPATSERVESAPRTLASGIAALPGANLALISTPGLYAATEARKALLAGMHVMIFSDNVSIEDEQKLKALASERGLLLMGPDCGTAIIGGVPLGFANVVRRGNIGVVGASGTGMQEVTSLIDRYGGGVSHAIGTGSRDLSQRIGGEMTLAGLRALIADPETKVIVLVSKPPHPEAAARVLEEVPRSNKPIVVAFLGFAPLDLKLTQANTSLFGVATLDTAALLAVELTNVTVPVEADAIIGSVEAARESLTPAQRYVRGLFSGGTFCYEAMLVMRSRNIEPIYSNTPLSQELALPNPHRSYRHTCLDLGADEFTVGRPHPMIDLSGRTQRILAEAADPEVAVLLLDVVLGYGAHSDPASVLANAIQEARQRAATEGRSLPVVASICGTQNDPQGLERQQHILEEAGVIIAPSNAMAARLAATIVGGQVTADSI